MRRVALTGGIATGKSWVLRRLASRGIATIDADRLAHEVLAPGTPGARRVHERFGPEVIDADGRIDRRTLGRIVFGDASARADLEAIVHPAVYEAISAWYASLPSSAVVAVADIPLLFETGRAGDFDEVIVAACPPEEQMRRLISRDGLSEREAKARLAAQWPIARKVARASAVIDTSGTHEQTDAQVDALVARWSA